MPGSSAGWTTRLACATANSSRSKRALRADARDCHRSDAIELARQRVAFTVQHLFVQSGVEHLEHESPPNVRALDVPTLLHFEIQAPKGRCARRGFGGSAVRHLRWDPAVEQPAPTDAPISAQVG